MNETTQANFEGWAVVEMMGHQQEIGFVTTQAFGQAVLFRIDTPELLEREYVLESPEYCGNRFAPVGTKVQRGGSPARSRFGLGWKEEVITALRQRADEIDQVIYAPEG